MTSEEIKKALEDFSEAAGADQGGAGSPAPALRFEQATAAPLADSVAGPEPQESSLDMDTMRKAASEREEAGELLRGARRRPSGRMAEVQSDAGTATQPGSAVQPHGVAVRVYPPDQQRPDAPGPGARTHIINEVTKQIELSQG